MPSDDDFLERMAIWASCEPTQLSLADLQRLLAMAGMSKRAIAGTTKGHSDPALLKRAGVLDAIRMARAAREGGG